MNTYHNSTELEGRELQLAIAAAVKQDDKVLIFFRNNPHKEFSPSQIHQAIFDESTPLTSTRRAMSNLTKKGYLQKTDNKATGHFGRKENKWRLYVWEKLNLFE